MGTTDAGSEQHVCPPASWHRLTPDDVEASIGDRFRAQVELHADCLAVRDDHLTLSYRALDDRASGVGAALGDVGVRAGARVVQLLEQGAPAVAATLGVLMMGAVHVPLDPGEPDDRLSSLLDRVRPSAAVTDVSGAARLVALGVGAPIVLADGHPGATASPVARVAPDALATIHFTSGSTGRPKGVLDLHRNIVHNALRYTLAIHITPADRLSLVHPPSSSAVMSSTFAALLNGAALFPYRLDVARLGSLAAWLRTERITIPHAVPSVMRRALGYGGVLPDVRVVRLEGDRAYGQDMATWRRHLRPGTSIANGLGTTETGLCRQLIVQVERELEDGIMPVGGPVTDMDARVVDDHGDALPPGEVGEIAITSRYLAVGYLDDETLTSAAFSPVPDRPGVRTYRTGDLGRLRSDGCLEYLGRSDGGAKVLGHRVEPAEVEAALATIAGVDAVAVKVVADASGEGHLVAWVVGTAAADQTALRAGAATLLPGHLRPTRYVPTDALPLAASGKVDRAALVEPVHATAHTAPTTDPLEPRVMEVVQRVLGHPIARHDDFFACGGDSLGAVDVVLALERVTGRRLPPSLLLAAPTVAGIATVLHERPLDPGPALMSLSIDGPGTPLVLVPSHFGNPLAYTDLARHLDGIRPVLASDVSPVDGDVIGMPFETVASRQVTAVRDTRPSGPYLLGGFCFGGAVAYDMARALIAAGDPPAGLFLLGVSPYDLPDLVPDGALERWERSETAMGKLERAARFGRGLTGSIGRRYLADRARSQARRVRELTSADGRELRRARDRRDARLRPSVGRYRGPALPIPVTLILPAWSLDAYAADPVALWAGVGSVVDVHVVPGVERMLLREPVVSEVARIMAGDPPS